MTQTMEETMSQTDRIEKKVVLRAPQSRVWRALTDSSEFGQWFGVKLDGDFKAGKPIKGKFSNPKYQHMVMTLMIERINPETLFSYRWHPYALDTSVDYSNEPTTLIEFRLEPIAEGTQLTVTESGFDKIPAHRRAEAFGMNEKGWASQVENIRRYVDG